MTNILEKISSYNILNNILPGVVFIFLWDRLFPQAQFDLNKDGYLENVFIYYFIGMIISRIGSVVIEDIYRKTKFVIYSDDKDYAKAEKLDNKLPILVETNNLYRTTTAIFFTLCVAKIIFFIYNNTICTALNQIIDDNPLKVMLALFILSSFSFKKQTAYIRQRVYDALQKTCTDPERR